MHKMAARLRDSSIGKASKASAVQSRSLTGGELCNAFYSAVDLRWAHLYPQQSKYRMGWVCAVEEGDLSVWACRLVVEATVLIQLVGSLQGARSPLV